MAKRQVRDVKYLEGQIEFLQDVADQRRADLTVAEDRITVLETARVAQNHELDNRRAQQIDMASRIGVLESDRDRLTTVSRDSGPPAGVTGRREGSQSIGLACEQREFHAQRN